MPRQRMQFVTTSRSKLLTVSASQRSIAPPRELGIGPEQIVAAEEVQVNNLWDVAEATKSCHGHQLWLHVLCDGLSTDKVFGHTLLIAIVELQR